MRHKQERHTKVPIQTMCCICYTFTNIYSGLYNYQLDIMSDKRDALLSLMYS